MPFSVALIRQLEKVVDPQLREVLYAILEEIERQRAQLEDQVTKKEFNELKEIVRELAEAQKQTEERLDRLEKIVEELAEAQKRTEEELRKLIGEHRKTREQLGGLSHTVGYILEDRAYKGLPPLLEKDFNLKLTQPLKRDFIEIAPGRFEEINILGPGQINGRKVWVIGEAKTQPKKRDIDAFLRKLQKIDDLLPGEKIPILVTYQTSPLVKEYAQKKGVKLYFSYEFPL